MIPVVDLSTNGSIRLSTCKKHGSMATSNDLPKCTVLEVSYMHGSQWVSLGKNETNAFEVTINHQPVRGGDVVVLKVSDITHGCFCHS